jgi:hypothetical protein
MSRFPPDSSCHLPTPEIELNDTIAQANVLGLSAENPTVSISGAMSAPNTSDLRFFGYSEDVDFYSVNLEPGQTLALDIDAGEPDVSFYVYPALEEVLQRLDSELRVFDAQGNELLRNSDGAAPGEVFSRDPYLEFTATEAGTYYVGVSQLGNRNYDPLIARSGSGWTFPEVGVFFGPYELTASLIDTPTPMPPAPTNQNLFGDSGNNVLSSGSGDDNLFGNGGNDIFNAGAGNDNIFGGAGNDIIDAGAGNDNIFGNGGNDVINAGSGDDIIYGGAGSSVINGGAGNDTLWLNGGSDVIVTRRAEGTDTINGFQVGQTKFGLTGGLQFSDLTFRQGSGFTEVLAGTELLAKVNFVNASSLNAASNFTTV